ncbi:MAG: HAD family hydrolase [Lentisphaeria bacterium]
MDGIRLICTDLDGTLLENSESQSELRRFGALLADCSRYWETRWAIVTGRRKIDAEPVLMHFLVMGMRPDFLVVEDGLIYQRNKRGRWAPFWWWNFQVMRKRFHLGRRSAEDIVKWRRES